MIVDRCHDFYIDFDHFFPLWVMMIMIDDDLGKYCFSRTNAEGAKV